MTPAEETIVIDPSGAGAASFNPTELTRPLGDATRAAYERVAGGFEWYFEHWGDLFAEIKAEQAARLETLALSDVLSALDTARVASDVPGRVRLRLPALKKQEALCEQVAESVYSLSGIESVRVSPVTGSILVHYDTGHYRSLDELRAAVAG